MTDQTVTFATLEAVNLARRSQGKSELHPVQAEQMWREREEAGLQFLLAPTMNPLNYLIGRP